MVTSDRVTAVIKLGGFVNSTADFTEQAKVINGASALMFEIFENKSKHAGSAVSCPSLPLGSSVEIDGVFEFN
jgi:enamine deaminase RidA (YjgF/YER057c/UK114 family)